jgi:hypothetical protein
MPGAGSLLGNLLCAVVNLLDPSVAGTVLGNAVLAGAPSGLIASLNQLLGGLLNGTRAYWASGYSGDTFPTRSGSRPPEHRAGVSPSQPEAH